MEEKPHKYEICVIVRWCSNPFSWVHMRFGHNLHEKDPKKLMNKLYNKSLRIHETIPYKLWHAYAWHTGIIGKATIVSISKSIKKQRVLVSCEFIKDKPIMTFLFHSGIVRHKVHKVHQVLIGCYTKVTCILCLFWNIMFYVQDILDFKSLLI